MENEVWTIIGASGKSINEGIPVSLNSIVGFKHKATECYLHSHDTNQGKFTPISKQQQGIIELNTKDKHILACINNLEF